MTTTKTTGSNPVSLTTEPTMETDEQILKKMIGKTLTSISGDVGEERMEFRDKDGDGFSLYHLQGCCESVNVEDIAGSLDDLLNSPLIKAEKRTSDKNPDGFAKKYQDSFTWTFYEFATIKGSVTIRWYGESNGYYSESVDIAALAA